MAYKIEERLVHGYQVNIYQDECAESPEAFGDEDCFLGQVSRRGRVTFGRLGWDKDMAVPYIPYGEGPWSVEGHDYYESGAQTEADIRKLYEEQRGWEYEVFPVEYRDYGCHGGKLCFSDDEDADGYIFVRVPWKTDCPIDRMAHEICEDFVALPERATYLLEQWNIYLSGEVYYVTICSRDGDVLEGMGGMYGMKDVNEGIKDGMGYYKDKTEKVDFIVVRSDMTAEVVSLDVPLYVGHTWQSWLEDHPLSNDNTVLQVVKYEPITYQQEVVNA